MFYRGSFLADESLALSFVPASTKIVKRNWIIGKELTLCIAWAGRSSVRSRAAFQKSVCSPRLAVISLKQADGECFLRKGYTAVGEKARCVGSASRAQSALCSLVCPSRSLFSSSRHSLVAPAWDQRAHVRGRASGGDRKREVKSSQKERRIVDFGL